MGMSEDQDNRSESRPPKCVVLDVDGKNVDADESSKVSLQRSSPKKKDFSRSQHHFSPRDKRRQLCGVRHLRRLENLNMLLSHAEADEDDSGQVDFVDLVSHQSSAFRDLFVEPEKMSAWVAFVNSSEEEQEHVLAAAEKLKLCEFFMDDADNDVDCGSDFVHIGQADDGMPNQPSAAQRDFEVTAHQCFQRINRNLRSFLRHNHFPNGELHRLEEELVAFFVEWPKSVYIADLPDGYRRLMLHAVSQYLDLDARSFDVPGSIAGRKTQVENSRSTESVFIPPPTPLATYIVDNKTTSMSVVA